MKSPVLVMTALAALAVAGCGKGGGRAPCPEGKLCLEYGNSVDPQSIDPQLASLVKQVQSASPDQQTDLLRQVNKELVDQAWFDVWYQADNIYFSDKGITVTPITGMMFPTLQFIQRG